MSGRGGGLHAETVIATDAENSGFKKIVAEAKIDEAGAGDFRRLANVIQLQSADDQLGDVAGGTPKLFGERHGEVGLKIAELRILGRANQIKQRGGIGDEFSEGRSETLTEQIEEVHVWSVLRQGQKVDVVVMSDLIGSEG